MSETAASDDAAVDVVFNALMDGGREKKFKYTKRSTEKGKGDG